MMKITNWQLGLPAIFLSFAAASTQAADISISGFASFVGGKATHQQKRKDGTNTSYVADPSYSRDNGEVNLKAEYGDDLSFRPDSNYGLQLVADVGENLTITSQVTARGATDFNNELESMYITYTASDALTFQAGRQRIPFYLYSDFLDVGYAYHWIRPPAEVYGGTVNTYEGLMATYKGQLGNWDASAQLYGGTTTSDQSQFGVLGSDDMKGLVLSANNSWLRVRASVLQGGFFIENSENNRDNPVDVTFSSAAAYLTLGNGFFAVEGTLTEPDSEDYIDTAIALPDEYTKLGISVKITKRTSFMATAGYEWGEFTPHVTFIESSADFGDQLDGLIAEVETTIVGVRWDFHPSAAFKLEYSSSEDKSTSTLINGQGHFYEVDTVTAGIDIIF